MPLCLEGNGLCDQRARGCSEQGQGHKEPNVHTSDSAKVQVFLSRCSAVFSVEYSLTTVTE